MNFQHVEILRDGLIRVHKELFEGIGLVEGSLDHGVDIGGDSPKSLLNLFGEDEVKAINTGEVEELCAFEEGYRLMNDIFAIDVADVNFIEVRFQTDRDRLLALLRLADNELRKGGDLLVNTHVLNVELFKYKRRDITTHIQKLYIYESLYF